MPAALTESPKFYPHVISGGAGSISSRVTIHYARAGIQTATISTDETRQRGGSPADRFQNSILKPLGELGPYPGVDRVVLPIGIHVNLTKPGAIHAVLSQLDDYFHPNQRMHFDSHMAAGFRAIAMRMGRIIGALEIRVEKKHEKLTEEDLNEATARLRELTTGDDSLRDSRETNHLAAIGLFNGLNEAGRLDRHSLTTNISSSPTDDLLHGRGVNAFYLGMATGKAEGETEQLILSTLNGQGYLNLVSPVVQETDVANMALRIRKILVHIRGEENIPKIQMVTKDMVAMAIIRETEMMLVEDTECIRRRYLGLRGRTYRTRPFGWRTPILPGF